MGPLVPSETRKEGGPTATLLIPALPITTPPLGKSRRDSASSKPEGQREGRAEVLASHLLPFLSLSAPLLCSWPHPEARTTGGQAGVHTMSDKG